MCCFVFFFLVCRSWHQGEILEVAQQKCGGAIGLEAAIRRQQVRAHGTPGQELYYFPKVNIGGGREWEATDSSSRQQLRSDQEHDDFNDGVQSLFSISNEGGSGNLAGMASFAVGKSTLEGLHGSHAASTQTQDERKEKLIEQQERLAKAIKLAEKISHLSCTTCSDSPLVADTLAQLMDVQEKADRTKSDVAFMLKYGKTTKGEQYDAVVHEKTMSGVMSCCDNIIEKCKVLKALAGTAAQPGVST